MLRQAGLQVDVLPVAGVHDLSPYQAVILGRAVYIGQWPKEAVAFLRVHEKALAARPVWLFSSGPTGEGDPVELVDGWRLPAGVRPVVDRIRPRDIVVFHGWINPEKINRIEKWAIQKLVKKPFGPRMSRGWPVGIQATLFTLPQLLASFLLTPVQGVIYAVVYSWLAVGVIGGWAADRTQSIWPSLVSAVIWNALMVAWVL